MYLNNAFGVRDRVDAIVAVLCAGLVVGLVSVTGSGVADEPEEPPQMVDSGSRYVRYEWPHDGRHPRRAGP
jgi:hypothetical protein